MRHLFLPALLTVGLLLTSCRTVCDARGPSEICELHHEYMETQLVELDKRPPPSEQYVEARFKYFAHSYPYAVPEKCKKCMVYVCTDCVRAEREWLRQHPQNNK